VSDVTTLDQFAHELLTHANNALATTEAGAINRAFVSPTLPALDCCPQLTVDVRSLGVEMTAPIAPVPTAGHRVGGPQPFLILATLVITVVRCTPIVTENELPSIAKMEKTSKETNQDLWAIWNAIATLKRDGQLFGGSCPALYLDPPVPLVAQGSCVGWVIQVRPAIDGYQSAAS
jgi:hypothetical protein